MLLAVILAVLNALLSGIVLATTKDFVLTLIVSITLWLCSLVLLTLAAT